jgi:hypothetical protein
MTSISHLPEHNYLVGEREADMEETGERELWSPEDKVLLYSAEDLDYARDYESEYIAETGSDIFLGCGPENHNSTYALNEATHMFNENFRRTHLGLNKSDIDALYAYRYGNGPRPRVLPKARRAHA